MLDRRAGLSLILAALTVMASVAVVVAQESKAFRFGATPADTPLATCASLASEPHTAFVPGLLHEGRSTYVHAQRNVTTDERTIVSGLALAQAQGDKPDAAALTSWTFERDEVCAFNLTRVLTITGAMDALALGIRESPVPPNATILVAFHTSAFRNVTIEEHNAIAALALARVGGRVNLSDVASIEEGNRTVRTFTRVVDEDQEQTALALALAPPQDAGTTTPTPLPPPPPQANSSRVSVAPAQPPQAQAAPPTPAPSSAAPAPLLGILPVS